MSQQGEVATSKANVTVASTSGGTTWREGTLPSPGVCLQELGLRDTLSGKGVLVTHQALRHSGRGATGVGVAPSWGSTLSPSPGITEAYSYISEQL